MNFSASYLKNLKNNLSWDILSNFLTSHQLRDIPLNNTIVRNVTSMQSNYRISSIHHIFLAVAADFKPPELYVS